MQASFECIQCLFKFSMQLVKRCARNEREKRELAKEVLQILSSEKLEQNPVIISHAISTRLREKTGVFDPYLKMKKERNRRAASILEQISKRIENSGDRLQALVKAATAGNILDTVAGDDDRLNECLDRIFSKGFEIDHFPIFSEKLSKAKKVLYITDNSGEIYFDRLLVEELSRMGKEMVVCVRGGPAADDALMEDYLECGMDRFSRVVTTGTCHQGCVLELASKELIREFEKADLIISKGMGNYETLGDIKDKRLFLILAVKCNPIARKIGARVGSFCLLWAG